MNWIRLTIKRQIHDWLFSIATVCIILLHQLDKITLETFIASITSVIALYLALLQQKLSNDKMFKELFTSFNSKYDQYNDLINRCDHNRKLELNDDEVNLIIDYFNLCSEEYLWFKKGRIPPEVWKAWKKGIQHNISITQINNLYNKERKLNDSYYGLFNELEN